MAEELNIKIAQRACPICENTRAKVLHHQKFLLPEGYPLDHSYDVVCCESCGFAYADVAASQDDYNRFYAQFSKYDNPQTGTGGGSTLLDRQRLKQTAIAIAAHLDNRSAKLLDIGCANGGLLNELKQLGYKDVQGLDPSPHAAAFAAREFGITIHNGTLFEFDTNIGRFDAVILSHVLEHVRDLKAALRNVRTLLEEDGVLYVEVPDATRYVECLVAPFQDFNTEHINHFGPDSLYNLLATAGFARVTHGAKTLEAAREVPYPAIYGFFAPAQSTLDARRDELLCVSLETYIERSQTRLDAMSLRMKAALWNNAGEAVPAIVWGVGQLAMKLLAETPLGEADVRYFLDGNPLHHGESLNGVPVIAPEEFAKMQQEYSACRDWPMVVASTIHQEAIAQRIRRELEWSNPIVTLAEG